MPNSTQKFFDNLSEQDQRIVLEAARQGFIYAWSQVAYASGLTVEDLNPVCEALADEFYPEPCTCNERSGLPCDTCKKISEEKYSREEIPFYG